jgi:molecular chaperone DnaK (HSP70)
LNDADKLKGKLSSDDQETLEDAIKEGEEFLNNNQSAEKDEFDEKRKELEGICDPIIQKGMGKGGADADDGEDEFSD